MCFAPPTDLSTILMNQVDNTFSSMLIQAQEEQ